MSLKFYIDTNIFLDSFLNRDEGIATEVLLFLEKRGVAIFLNDITVVNIAYILRRSFSQDEIKKKIDFILNKYGVVCAKQKIIVESNRSNFKDFEDGIQYFCAKEIEADLIITNNIDDFQNSDIEVITSKVFYENYVQ